MSDKPQNSVVFPRRILSFVLREGRFTQGQLRAFDEIWPTMGIEYSPEVLDLPAIYGNDNPVYLEIGFGNGSSLAQMALDNPTKNYLGVEVHGPGVGHLLIQIQEKGLTNVRVMRHDAVDILDHCLSENALAGVMLFFPDPWHKTKHRKRRIVQRSFLEKIARLIRPQGTFHAATDWKDYARHMMKALMQSQDLFSNTQAGEEYTPRPAYRQLTKFEQRGHRLGHGVWDLIFRRI